MGDPHIVWFFHPQYQLRYFYDDHSDQIVYENGARTARPSHISREQYMAARYQTTFGDPNIPRTVPHYPPGAAAQHDAPPASNDYVFAAGRPPPPIPNTAGPTSQGSHTYGQHISGPVAPSNSSMQPLSPTELTAVMNSMSLGGSRRRLSYHPPVARTSQNPQEYSMQVYTTPARMLRSTPQIPEPIPEAEAVLYSTFRRRAKSKKFFVVGKVFLTLWNEPAGDVGSDYTAMTSAVSMGRFGEPIYSKIRRFVIVRPGEYSCAALPILTYKGQGVGKQGVKKSEHAIIYTGKNAPSPHPSERPRRGEEGLLPQAIRVDPDDVTEKLDPWSRVNFGKVYNIEHNVKVRSLGKVNAASMSVLLYQFRVAWEENLGGPGSQLHIQTPRGVRVETVEASESSQRADFVGAYTTLLANGFTTEQIRGVLRGGFQLPSAGQPGNPADENEQGEAASDDEDSDEAEDDAEGDQQDVLIRKDQRPIPSS